MAARQFDIHFRDYARVVLKHLWVVLAAIAVVCSTVWLTSRDQPVNYQTEGMIEIRGIRPQTLQGVDMNPYEASKEFRTLLELIQSNQLSERVAGRLSPEALLELGSPGDTAGAAGILRIRIQVNHRVATNLVTIGVVGTRPEALAEIVNHHMSEFRDWNEERLRGNVGKVLEKLEVERPAFETEVNDARQSLFQFRDSHPEINFENPDTNQGQILQELNQQLVSLLTREVELEGQVQTARRASSLSQKRALPEIQRDEALKGLEADERELRRARLDLLQRGFGEEHRDVKQNEERLKENVRAQDDLVESLAQGMIWEYEDLARRMKRMQALVDKHRQEWFEFNKTLNGYQNLSEELLSKKSALDRHLDRIKQARADTQLQYETIKIIDEAKIPLSPLPVGVGIGYVFGIFMGLAVGVGIAFFLEYLDDTVRSREDVEKYIETPLLGHVPYIEGDKDQPESKDTITHRQAKSTVSEAYRAIRTTLVYAVAEATGGTGPLVMVVTSAGPREGKTTNAVNLAITMAHSGSRVLLVDADLRRPRIHRSFGMDHEVGLTNYLVGADPLRSVVRGTNIDNLEVVTSGPLPPNPYELLGSPKMEEFLKDARGSYDCVVIDTPPMGAVSDACLLGGMADGVVQIIAAAKTRRRVARLGKEQLARVGARVIGVILNCAAPAKPSYYGYYGYYYDSEYYAYYAYYGEDGAEKTGNGTGHRRRRSGTEAAG